jgi:putative transcriptional regulator
MERTIENSVLEQRTVHNLTQEELAKTVGVSRQTILAIEKGKYSPSVVLALKIAHAFGVRVEDIFQLTNLKK